MIRGLDELVRSDDSARPGVVEAAAASAVVLPLEEGRGARTLLRLQVTTRSVLGALAFHCGGLLVDHGWLRILGGGASGLPDLATANGLGEPGPGSTPPASLVVAFDVLGGRFAVDGGGLGVAPGEVCYRGPDTLDWTGLGTGHGGFVHWALEGSGLARFYEALRWEGWETDVAAVPLSHGLSVWPPPFAVESGEGASRRAVPFEQLVAFYDDAARQLGDVGDGESFVVRVTD